MVSNEMGRVRGQEKAAVTTYLIPEEPHHYYSLLRFMDGLILAYVDSILSSTVVQGEED